MFKSEFEIPHKLVEAEKLIVFLDYDGTLAEFADTPDIILPQQEVIRRVQLLADDPQCHVIILSGRRLSHVLELLPVKGIWHAGTYGIEISTPAGDRIQRLPFNQLRPVLDRLRPKWEQLLFGRNGFYLEDKGWSLAVHARFAEAVEAEAVMQEAHQMGARAAAQGPFQLLGGDRFLEIAPESASKAKTVEYFLSFPEYAGSLPLYLGDDDKDEAAYPAVQALGGVAIKVGDRGESVANLQLANPQEARLWLDGLIASRNNQN